MAAIHLKPESDERIILIAHRHWIALAQRELIPALVALVCVTVAGLRIVNRQPDFLGRTPPLVDLLSALLGLGVVAALAVMVYIYFDWKNDHLIVTNKRVVHEDRTLWLAYQFETIPLEQVQNVNIRTENIFQYLLKYGRAEVQAAGPTNPIIFDRASMPGEIQKEVLGEVSRQKRSQEQVRLTATVQRRLDPSAPPPPPMPSLAAQEIQNPGGPMQLILPLGPQVHGSTVIWHRHWIVLLQFMLWPIGMLIVWLGLLWAVLRYGLLDPSTSTIVLFGLFVGIVLFFIWQYENWRNDIYILEPTKIIDVQRLPFGLFEDRREATLGVIQNVNASSPNLIARVFGYGDVLIETAGTGGNFTFDHVPDPAKVQRVVFEYRERFKWMQREREWGNTLDIVEAYLRSQSPPPHQP